MTKSLESLDAKEQPIWAIRILINSTSAGMYHYFKRHLTYTEAILQLEYLQVDLAAIKAMPNAEWFLAKYISFEIVKKD